MRFVSVGKQRGKFLVFVAILAALLLPGAKCTHEPAPQYTCGPSKNVQPVAGTGVTWAYGDFPFDAGLFAGDLFEQINDFRTSRHLSSLQWHDGMALVARNHATDMFNKQYLSLVDQNGVTMCQAMVSSVPRIDFDQAYDFVGFTQFPTGMFTSMVNDPSALTVMEDPTITHFGASFQSNPGPYYVAAIFAVNARP